MESIREIYRIGHGPSSSHTMGPRKAAEIFLKEIPDASRYQITLYGSLAATGKGHLTGVTIEEIFKDKQFEILWMPHIFLPRHPNALKFTALNEAGEILKEWTAYSVGGGAIVDDNSVSETKQVYELSTMSDILDWCQKNGKQLWEYVEVCEG
ncbi:MAG: serine dehydratase beta chain, partial [Bacteroidota bacterium]|nr:serine dehydratase beta chain [Bacteroidota bacterium]